LIDIKARVFPASQDRRTLLRGLKMYKTILLYLPTPQSAQVIVNEVAELARDHGAMLIGAHSIVKITVYGGIPQDILAQHDERERREAEAVKSIFEEAAQRYNLPHQWRARAAQDTEVFREIVAQCRSVDLVVAPGKDFSDPLGHWYDLPERLAMETGRPLLLLPREKAVASLGKRIMVAWNGSREATRAAFDALPMLQAANSVCVLTLADRLDGPLATGAGDFTAALNRHGVNAELALVAATPKPDGEELLGHAAERNCDMLVMGFYGRSRLSEMLWGGVTRHMLQATTIPVLTSH
jgi:nucleotide-binding universal stress UspA family protein